MCHLVIRTPGQPPRAAMSSKNSSSPPSPVLINFSVDEKAAMLDEHYTYDWYEYPEAKWSTTDIDTMDAGFENAYLSKMRDMHCAVG